MATTNAKAPTKANTTVDPPQAQTPVAAGADNAPARSPGGNAGLPRISAERLPYHPAIEERFGIDRASWRALVEAVFPLAQSIDSVLMALSYCRARKLDPFKRVVHIVPIWDSNKKRMVDTVWPGIGELRTTAFRTGQFAGRDPTTYGPDITRKVGNVEMTFPEWAQVTVYRMLNGQRVAFAGPQVYWLEAYAQLKRDDPTPNSMWQKRPRGQLDKCAEAAALRAAFPEEVGNEYCSDEAHNVVIGSDESLRSGVPEGGSRSEQLAALLESSSEPAVPAENSEHLAESIAERIRDAESEVDCEMIRSEIDEANRQQVLPMAAVVDLNKKLAAREAEIKGETLPERQPPSLSSE